VYSPTPRYTKEDRFAPKFLLYLTPTQIYQWLCHLAFGKPNPNMEVDRPIYARSSTVEHYKKSVSYYMPHRLTAWNWTTNPPSGNPTKSLEVNNLVKAMKKFEVRKEGVEPNAKRDFTAEEVRCLLTLMEAQPGWHKSSE
jgi:hypothetical protein